jgi:Na+/proline symporter
MVIIIKKKQKSLKEDIMKQNIHNVERVIRVILGLIILSLVFVGPKTLWGLVGLLPIATGLIGWCPPYQLLGISTCKRK